MAQAKATQTSLRINGLEAFILRVNRCYDDKIKRIKAAKALALPTEIVANTTQKVCIFHVLNVLLQVFPFLS